MKSIGYFRGYKVGLAMVEIGVVSGGYDVKGSSDLANEECDNLALGSMVVTGDSHHTNMEISFLSMVMCTKRRGGQKGNDGLFRHSTRIGKGLFSEPYWEVHEPGDSGLECVAVYASKNLEGGGQSGWADLGMHKEDKHDERASSYRGVLQSKGDLSTANSNLKRASEVPLKGKVIMSESLKRRMANSNDNRLGGDKPGGFMMATKPSTTGEMKHRLRGPSRGSIQVNKGAILQQQETGEEALIGSSKYIGSGQSNSLTHHSAKKALGE
ncbi:unnamed protein product [Thlaspi arvense]|uniref:Uncharacterized protein n=1 Tax=Thlaspi arvense TaxID=13288 RepID=A0AAU9SBH4_THLAR|nr:unnamed protein product [Thlaspi arvense]